MLTIEVRDRFEYLVQRLPELGAQVARGQGSDIEKVKAMKMQRPWRHMTDWKTNQDATLKAYIVIEV